MGKIEKFEKITCWQIARELVKEVYSSTKNKFFGNDYALKNQMQRSAISIMANIAEGFERYSKKEFIQFLIIAKGSAGELRSHLYIALDQGYINKEEYERLKDKCEHVSRSVWNFTKYLKQN